MSQFLGAGVVSLSDLCMPGGIFLRALRPFRSDCCPWPKAIVLTLASGKQSLDAGDKRYPERRLWEALRP